MMALMSIAESGSTTGTIIAQAVSAGEAGA
jgi:hypothetical protein